MNGNESYGSGFYVNVDNVIYLITAGYVLFNLKTGNIISDNVEFVSYTFDNNVANKNVIRADLNALYKSKNARLHNTHDIGIVKIGSLQYIDGKSRVKFDGNIKIISDYRQIWGAGKDIIKRHENVLESNDAYIFGYPRSLGMKSSLFKYSMQIDPDFQLLRKGIVAGKDNYTKTIILDCPGYPGNSGGPALEAESRDDGSVDFRIIGVIIEFVPFMNNGQVSNSGYSIVESMDMVLDSLWK